MTVVDNASGDGTADLVQQRFPEVNLNSRWIATWASLRPTTWLRGTSPGSRCCC